MTPDKKGRLGVALDQGALVEFAPQGGPAAQAGIRGGAHVAKIDGAPEELGRGVIVARDGRPVRSRDELVALLGTLQPEQTVPVKLVRDGRTLTVQVTLANDPLAS
jgi:S1-C subfamily serine protease